MKLYIFNVECCIFILLPFHLLFYPCSLHLDLWMIRNTFKNFPDILYVSIYNFRVDICFNSVTNAFSSSIVLISVHAVLDSAENIWAALWALASRMQCTEFSEMVYQSYNLWSSWALFCVVKKTLEEKKYIKTPVFKRQS